MKHPAKLLAAAATALVLVAMLAPAAGATTPAPGFERFAGCPSPAENPNVQLCVYSKVKSGHFQMGSKEVPIENPMTLTGGVGEAFSNFQANSKGGLSPVKQKVPGGVIGLTGLTWLLEFLGSQALTLYAETELAGQPSFGITGIGLPIKVHLVNSVLGNNCRVGSNTNPISLHLTFGTTNPPPPNEPISGVTPQFELDEEKGFLKLLNGTYVDNSFAAPGASGCVLTLFGFIPISINGLVNTQSGLPAAAGTNETVQNIDTEFTLVTNVYP
jgi:hypothetical protein